MAIVLTQRAEARETGSIHGRILDEAERPLPRAELTLRGVELAGERDTTTRDDGTFRFESVPPGSYELEVAREGAPLGLVRVKVSLLTSTEVHLRLDSSETFGPWIDPRSATFGASFSEENLHVLPYRTYQDVLRTVPGVAGRIDTVDGGPGDGDPSARGEGAEGNNTFVDGFSIRDPATKGVGRDVPFDAIESIHVYTDGAPAEFGRFTGMAVDIATKDGGDEHHGRLALYYQQHAWLNETESILDPGEQVEVPTTKPRFRTPSLAASAGGPLAPERLWYFTALELDHTRTWDAFPADEAASDMAEPDDTSTGGSLFGKLTWFSRALTLRYTLDGRIRSSEAFDAGPLVAEEATSDRRDWTHSHLLTATVAPGAADEIALRLGYSNANLDVVPSSGDETVPSRVDDLGVLHDNAVAFDRIDRNRLGASLHYTRVQDRALGDHLFRVGLEVEEVRDQREIVHTGRTEIEWIGTNGQPTGTPVDVGTHYRGGAGLPCDSATDTSNCWIVEHWTNQGPIGTSVRTFGAFVQDRWQPWRWMTVEAGVRLDLEDARNNDGDPPLTPAEGGGTPEPYRPPLVPQPRIGIALDPFDDGRTNITAHYGRYADVATTGFWHWATSDDQGFVMLRNDGSGDGDPFVWTATQDPVSLTLPYAADLAPMHLDKVIAGIEREIMKDLSIGARGIVSKTSDLADDVNIDLYNFVILNPTIKLRDYRALELTLKKRFDERWHLSGSYTLQESKGHMPGQPELLAGSGNASGVSLYLDDVGERSAREDLITSPYAYLLDGLAGLGRYSVTDPTYHDDAGWYGFLPYHSFHSVKLDGSYTAPIGTTIGLVYELDSGHAWQKRTFVGFYSYDGFAEGRGSRLMPPVHYVDLHLAQTLSLGGSRSLDLTVDVTNVPGFAQSITKFEPDRPDFGSTLYRQAPRSARVGVAVRY